MGVSPQILENYSLLKEINYKLFMACLRLKKKKKKKKMVNLVNITQTT